MCSTTTPTTLSAYPVTAVGRRYLSLYQLQKYCDCSFQIDDIVINCHKLILSSASPVFEAMFYGPMSTLSSSDTNDNDKCVKIIDISPETFKIMIEYIYAGEIEFKKLELETIIELYYSSEKYLINDLILDCSKEIKKKLEYKNILQALDLSVYMGLQPLLKILLQYFDKYCLTNGSYQFMNSLELYYYHISRDCLKCIIDTIKDSGNLTAIWFIQFWSKKECKILGLHEKEHITLLKDFDIDDNDLNNSKIHDAKLNNQVISMKGKICIPNYIERHYFKALRPIVITENFKEFSTKLKTDRFITLLGFTMHGRILPKVLSHNNDYNNFYDHYQRYTESFDIHIWSNNCVLIYQQKILLPNINYNCDLNITLLKNVILSHDFEYELKIIWNDTNSYGAEYPLSLYSNNVKGITFLDNDHSDDDDDDHINNRRDFNSLQNNDGGIIKGIRYLNQI